MVSHIMKICISNIIKFNIIHKKRKSIFFLMICAFGIFFKKPIHFPMFTKIFSLFLFQSSNIHIWDFNLVRKWGWNSCTLYFVYRQLNCSLVHSIVGPFQWLVMTPYIHVFFFLPWDYSSISLAYFLFLWTNTTFSSS